MLSRHRLVGAALLGGHLARHAARRPPVCSLEQRLAMLPAEGAPVDRPVTIRWNRHHVPFIEAETDADLAVALGMVHAHLRLGQIEVMRHLAQGRVAEMIGPLGIEADRLLRTLDFGRAVPASLAAMPPSTRTWLDGFVRGLNHYLLHCAVLPAEFTLFALGRRPWSVADVLTVGRLVSADVNWMVWSQLMKFRGDADWPQLWRKVLSIDALSGWTSPDNALGDAASAILGAPMRFGSNSLVVAPQRSATGAALIASDPHLSLTLPSPWLIAAFKSPSYHAVGLMLPGMPFIALGRNAAIAWGGTSLHAASSDLLQLPADLPGIARREERLAVRWGTARTIPLRETQWGPILSDVAFLPAGSETIALRWTGHRPSDEITAMLGVNRAQNWDAFRAALDGFALPGQTMLYADTAGRIGRLMAVHVPRRDDAPPDDIVRAPVDGWDVMLTSQHLPAIIDPTEGFIASANERPAGTAPLVGYHFSRPDRKRRLDHLLGAADHLSVADVSAIQRDVHWADALAGCRQFLAWTDPAIRQGPRERRLVAALAEWDGCFDAGSRGALAFELLCYHLARRLIPRRRRTAYDAAWGTRRLIWQDIRSADPARRQRAMRSALHAAARAFGAHETWGDRHRLRLGHMLAMTPVLGRAWRFTDLPATGTTDTLYKTAHPLTDQRHGSRYGSGARHISDLSDLDRNHFVLVGGQDGWFGSTTFLDQVDVWRRGDYITVPLRPETARATFPYRTDIIP